MNRRQNENHIGNSTSDQLHHYRIPFHSNKGDLDDFLKRNYNHASLNVHSFCRDYEIKHDIP